VLHESRPARERTVEKQGSGGGLGLYILAGVTAHRRGQSPRAWGSERTGCVRPRGATVVCFQ